MVTILVGPVVVPVLLTLVTFKSIFLIWYTFSDGPVLYRLGSFLGIRWVKILLIRLLVTWTLKESLFDDPCIPNVDDGSVVYVAADGVGIGVGVGAGAGVIVVVVVDEPLGLFVVVMVVGVLDVMMILVEGAEVAGAGDVVLIYEALLFCCGCCWVYALYIFVGC